MRKITLDVETRSAAKLPKVGPWAYAEHPTTDVWCMAVHAPSSVWYEAEDHFEIDEYFHSPEADIRLATFSPVPFSFHEYSGYIPWTTLGPYFQYWLSQDDIVFEAHNAGFEQAIFHSILGPRYQFPVPPVERWRCSAAKAALYGLPRALAKGAAALRLEERKDTEGAKVMKKLARPRKWDKETGVVETWWDDSRENFETLFEYCIQDVRTEHVLSASCPEMSDSELAAWHMDQRANNFGMRADLELADKALEIKAEIDKDLTATLQRITRGKIENARSRKDVLAWIQERDPTVKNTQRTTLEALVDSSNDSTLSQVCGIINSLNRSSIAKFDTVQRTVCKDGRLRGLLVYHGAHTGRWTGALLQPQNLPRGFSGSEMEDACDLVLCGKEAILLMYKNVIETLSKSIRGVLLPDEGMQLGVADFASIEARILVWLARDSKMLQVFIDGGDPYCEMASSIFNRPAAEILAAYKSGSYEGWFMRFVGKQAILGLGYGMGAQRFQDEAKDKYNIDLPWALCDSTVRIYRERFQDTVVAMWSAIEKAAMRVVRFGGEFETNRVVWRMEHHTRGGIEKHPVLTCELPSGRKLHYHCPSVRRARKVFKRRDGSEYVRVQNTLHFWGLHPLSKKWVEKTTWGGTLVENIDQAIARDCMAHALLKADRDPMLQVLLSVHDEGITQGPRGSDPGGRLTKIMQERPPWGLDIPLGAEGWTGERYRK